MSKIAIMGAMPEEIEPIISKLENLKETVYAANTMKALTMVEKLL